MCNINPVKLKITLEIVCYSKKNHNVMEFHF